LVATARVRGIPASIYRAGRITGHSSTGASNRDDLASRYIKGCIQIGAMPEDEATFDMTPVDFVSAAIVELSMSELPPGKNYHLLTPRPLRASELASAIGSFGYALERVPYARWRERLAGPDGQDNSLRPLMFLFPPEERPQDGVSETSMGAGAGPP